MMVQRRHQQHAPVEQLERDDLDRHRGGLDHEEAADDEQDELGAA